jgi:8-oxo-dGTP diphosphatase
MKQVVAAFMVQNHCLLICQRIEDQPMPLKWEFPGGKIEPGEQPRVALRRELEEELGVLADIGEEVVRLEHEYANSGLIELRFFLVKDWEGEITNRIFRSIRWVRRLELLRFDFLDADRRLVQDIAAGSWPRIFADHDGSQ